MLTHEELELPCMVGGGGGAGASIPSGGGALVQWCWWGRSSRRGGVDIAVAGAAGGASLPVNLQDGAWVLLELQ